MRQELGSIEVDAYARNFFFKKARCVHYGNHVMSALRAIRLPWM